MRAHEALEISKPQIRCCTDSMRTLLILILCLALSGCAAIATGAPKTPFMKFGDTVRIEMKDKTGHSIFGAIEQTVQKYEKG